MSVAGASDAPPAGRRVVVCRVERVLGIAARIGQRLVPAQHRRHGTNRPAHIEDIGPQQKRQREVVDTVVADVLQRIGGVSSKTARMFSIGDWPYLLNAERAWEPLYRAVQPRLAEFQPNQSASAAT